MINTDNNKVSKIWDKLSRQVHRFVFLEEIAQQQQEEKINDNNTQQVTEKNNDSNNNTSTTSSTTRTTSNDDDDDNQDAENETLQQPLRRRNQRHHPNSSNNSTNTNSIHNTNTNSNRGPTTATAATAAAAQSFPPLPTSWVRGYLSETPWTSLHTRPTVLTIFISMCVFLPVCLWLQTTVLDTTSHLSVFFVGSCFVTLGYYIIYKGLSAWSTSFGRLSRDKQIYAVSNLMKASVLASITPIAVYQLTMIVAYDRWDNTTLRNVGCLYAVPDFVSLMLVRRMAATTVIHHMCVVLFNFYSIHNDYREDNVIRLIVVYGAFSTFGYVVYLLLASRFLGVSPAVSRHLSAGALVVYVACCGINWTWQASYLRHLLQSDTKGEHRTSVFVYMVAVSFVMWDDLALNRWLLQNVRTRAHQHQQVAKSFLLRGHSSSGNSSGNGGSIAANGDDDDGDENDESTGSRKKINNHQIRTFRDEEENRANDSNTSDERRVNDTSRIAHRHPVLQPIRVSRNGNSSNNKSRSGEATNAATTVSQ